MAIAGGTGISRLRIAAMAAVGALAGVLFHGVPPCIGGTLHTVFGPEVMVAVSGGLWALVLAGLHVLWAGEWQARTCLSKNLL